MMIYGAKTWVFGLVSLGVLLLGMACQSSSGETGANTTAAQGPATEVRVAMGDFFYDPKEITVEAGRVRFLLSNVGQTAHRFAVTGEGVNVSSKNVGAGRESVLETDLRPGTYKMGCTL
ncbi:MAG: cupredoxin domain-containing protein, partial [Chloroflexi bacterium]|nr:cupredoxin domain-containing protein [Chloroflexota bacterium]